MENPNVAIIKVALTRAAEELKNNNLSLAEAYLALARKTISQALNIDLLDEVSHA